MPEPAAAVDSPVIRITVEVPPALAELLTRSGWHDRLTAEISRVAMELLATLGVPGRSAVVLAGRDGEGQLQVRVEDALCRCGANFFNELHSLFLHHLPPPGADVSSVTEWLFELARSSADPESVPGRQSIEFIATACGELLRRKPSRLLGEVQAEAYRQRLLPYWQEALPAAALRPWLAEALDFGLTIADLSGIAAALQEGLRQQHDPHELAEDLIAALQPEEIEIRLEPGYLRALTEGEAPAGEEETLFAMMRDSLFFELGLMLPSFRWATDAQLAPGCFAFKLNHRVTLPRRGLAPTERLANDTVERLRLLNLQALSAAAHPANGMSVSVLSSVEAEKAAQAGVTTWTPLAYLTLCLSSELRQHAAALLSHGAVDYAREQFDHVLPALMSAARERLSPGRLYRVLRELLAEEVSIRPLPQILEAILDCDHVLADESSKIVFDDRLAFRVEPPADWKKDPALLAASVRRSLKNYLSYKYTRGQAAMTVYLLAPELEAKLAAQSPGTPLSEAEADLILRAVRSKIDPLRPSDPPVVLTTTEARRTLRQLIAPLYPWLPVLAYQELSPEMNVQPLARISLG